MRIYMKQMVSLSSCTPLPLLLNPLFQKDTWPSVKPRQEWNILYWGKVYLSPFMKPAL